MPQVFPATDPAPEPKRNNCLYIPPALNGTDFRRFQRGSQTHFLAALIDSNPSWREIPADRLYPQQVESSSPTPLTTREKLCQAGACVISCKVSSDRRLYPRDSRRFSTPFQSLVSSHTTAGHMNVRSCIQPSVTPPSATIFRQHRLTRTVVVARRFGNLM